MQGMLSAAQMDALLCSESFGHLGCTDGLKPYVVPMAFVYHDNVLYGQTTEGKKVEMLRRNPLVCFQVEHLGDRNWNSVICWGNFEELSFEELQKPESVRIVELLSMKIGSIQKQVGVSIPFSFVEAAVPLTVNEKKSTLFRIVIAEKTGKFYRED